MRKIKLILLAFILSLNCANAVPISASISRDYDFSFESIIKHKFKELIRFSKIFEKNDDIFYHKGYRPSYMLSIKEVYSFTPTIQSNIEKREVPNTYNLSFSNAPLKEEENIEEIYNNTQKNEKTFENTQKRFKEVIAKNPNRIEILYKYAQFLYSNSKYIDAITVLKDITIKENGFVLAYYTLGNIYFDMGQYKESIKANLSVIKRNPYCADAYFNIASALEKLHKFNLALDYYQKCLSINANDSQAQKALKRLEQITYNIGD